MKFFTVGGPTLLYILLSNLALSNFLLVDPTIFSSTVVIKLKFLYYIWDLRHIDLVYFF